MNSDAGKPYRGPRSSLFLEANININFLLVTVFLCSYWLDSLRQISQQATMCAFDNSCWKVFEQAARQSRIPGRLPHDFFGDHKVRPTMFFGWRLQMRCSMVVIIRVNDAMAKVTATVNFTIRQQLQVVETTRIWGFLLSKLLSFAWKMV